MTRRHLRLVEDWPVEDLRLLDVLLAAYFLVGLGIGLLAGWAVFG